MSWVIWRRSPPIWSRRNTAPSRRCCCSSPSCICGRRACSGGGDGRMRATLTSRLFWIGAATLVLASVLPLWVSGYVLGLLTVAYYTAVFAMSWDLLFGFAGEVNFGPTFLIGVGAYTAALLNHYWMWPIPACLVAGAIAAVIGGAVL